MTLDQPHVLSRRLELALIVIVAAAGGIAVWLFSERSMADAIETAIAFGGAAVAAALVPRRAGVAVGLVFLLSSWSLIDVELPVGRMRLEQPAIAALVASIALHWRQIKAPPLREIRLPLAAAGVYLGVSTVSSAVVAPDPGQSLRLVTWTAISMAGGLAAYLLTANREVRVTAWFARSGALMAAVGLALGVAFFVHGPGAPGIMVPMSTNPKVFALALEANLYASLLAATAFFALDRLRAGRALASAAALALILVGLGVGMTRGAYIALLVGFVAYAIALWRGRDLRPSVRFITLAAVVLTAAGMVVGAVLMDTDVRDRNLVARGLPPPEPGAHDDLTTVEYRLQRVGPAIDDIRASPVIGHGLASLDQLHPLPRGELNYINIMALATVHDSGIVGALALAGFFAVVLARLWRTTDPARAGPAAAYLAAILALLVAYQATNAIHFALNWLVAGAALGLAAGARRHALPDEPATSR